MHEQLGYAYDAAGNLNYRTNNALTQNFNVNSLNQISNVTRNATNALTVAGTTTMPATRVTVNGSSATLYSDSTFAKSGFTPVNGDNTYTAIAQDSLSRLDTNSITVYLPTNAVYAYDQNGNLTNDSKRVFTYDDENQLTGIVVSNEWKAEFVYDGKMRRRIERNYEWRNSTWVKTSETRFVYDGNVVIQERNENNTPVVTLTRGKDLSGSLEGAGGIGGLLARSHGYSRGTGNWSTHNCYFADGNGNVTYMVNSSQSMVAKYRYDPFGNSISKSGTLSDANVYRFSSKEIHVNSGLYYYGYRWYAPNLQRWLNRDPIAERGGINLYGFVANRPVNAIDTDGRQLWRLPPPPPPPDTTIKKCNRKIENDENDFIIGLANTRGHDYFGWPDPNGGTDGVGFRDPNGQDGDLPQSEAGSKARSCRPCYKSNSPLKYGKGAGKPGTSASNDDIKDCLKNRPIKGNYHGTKNNCNDWAKGVEKDCGLFCP